jgi:hypothetical protein
MEVDLDTDLEKTRRAMNELGVALEKFASHIREDLGRLMENWQVIALTWGERIKKDDLNSAWDALNQMQKEIERTKKLDRSASVKTPRFATKRKRKRKGQAGRATRKTRKN